MRKIAACIAVAVLVPSVLTGCIRKVEEAPKETTAAVEETQEAADQAGSKTAAGTEADAGNASGTEAEAKNSSGTEADVPDAADTEADTTSSKGSTAADTTSAKGSGEVVVYNWGEYLDPDLIDQFEEDTGIKVIYEEYETNEIMYPKVVAGAATYDVICPSDYMVSKMIANDLLQPINFDHIPNIKNIGKTYMEQADGFDPGNKYAVPYVWGTIGILYNKSMIEEGDVVDSWEILWDEKYKDSILMQDSIRDCFMVPQKILGYDMNTVDEEEIKECAQLLIDQKPLVQAYVVDQARDKMIAGEAALAVIYSGEAIYAHRENEDLEYVIPKEGTDVWIDCWVIPKNARNVENAEKFIDYMCRPESALNTFEYITYSTPNEAGRELIEDEEIRNSPIAFPTKEMLANSGVISYVGEEGDELYAKYWNKVKSS